ncbi:MAG: membrane protein insertion efficiency factor YidD [Candidatus Paceibacterota bacterium]
MHWLKKLPNYLALGVIWLYRTFIAPFYTKPHCIFYPTCSQYGQECFKKYPFWTALRKTLHRISRCHPGNDPQVDLP